MTNLLLCHISPVMKPQWGKCCSKLLKLDPYTNQFHPNSGMLLTMRQLWKCAAAHNQSIRGTLDSAICFFCHPWNSMILWPLMSQLRSRIFSGWPTIFKLSPLQSCLLSWVEGLLHGAHLHAWLSICIWPLFFLKGQMDPRNHSCKTRRGEATPQPRENSAVWFWF